MKPRRGARARGLAYVIASPPIGNLKMLAITRHMGNLPSSSSSETSFQFVPVATEKTFSCIHWGR
jgi:hypothetical protein